MEKPGSSAELEGMNIYNLKKILVGFSMLCCLIMFSAFSYQPSRPLLTRIDLALFIEGILSRHQVQIPVDAQVSLNDLDAVQQKSVATTLALKIMTGYPDGSFRPDESVRNLETICYLQKLGRFLRKNNPGLYETRQLMRIFAYQSQPDVVLSGKAQGGSFPAEFSDPGGFVEKAVFENLMLTLLSSSENHQFVLNGKAVNALTGEPVAGAYIAGERQTAQTDAAGCFFLKFSGEHGSEVELFAAAEGFTPVELKKDLRLNPTIIFRLKPEKPVGKASR